MENALDASDLSMHKWKHDCDELTLQCFCHLPRRFGHQVSDANPMLPQQPAACCGRPTILCRPAPPPPPEKQELKLNF